MLIELPEGEPPKAPMFYTLDGKTPVPTNDVMVWAKFLEKADRHVAQETIGRVWISTVFLGLDHAFGFGPSLLFETMVFGDGLILDGEMDRYSTWEQAETGHRAMVGQQQVILDNLKSMLR